MVDLLEGLKAAPLAVLIGERGRGVGRWAWKGLQTHAPDIEVLLEAIGLEQVGEFERADIAATFADFALQVADNSAQVFRREARPQPFKPLSFPVKSQAQALSGQLAVELMDRGDLLGANGWRHTFS